MKVSECSSGGLGPRHTTDETLIRSFRGEELFRQREALLMQSYCSLSSFFPGTDFPQVITKPSSHKHAQPETIAMSTHNVLFVHTKTVLFENALESGYI